MCEDHKNETNESPSASESPAAEDKSSERTSGLAAACGCGPKMKKMFADGGGWESMLERMLAAFCGGDRGQEPLSSSEGERRNPSKRC